ncbi:MAG TPA: conjugal transfer protein TraD [Acidocella sp.]|nr:MAG: hypothetical protein B7Z80_23790 [Rhodospirillales bacterium 20-64-7]HQT47254.1 conjugal transfer protein TraD [Acidocella sp.]
MAGFDETALKRLEALVARSKASGKLPASEALELKELKLLRQTAEIAKSRADIAVAKRKIEDREKYRVGGLAVAVGLSRWNDDELKGGFTKLAELSDAVRAELAVKGKQVRVSFQDAPDDVVLTALKKRGFKWNATAKAWDGSGEPADVQGEAELGGGMVEPLPLQPGR